MKVEQSGHPTFLASWIKTCCLNKLHNIPCASAVHVRSALNSCLGNISCRPWVCNRRYPPFKLSNQSWSGPMWFYPFYLHFLLLQPAPCSTFYLKLDRKCRVTINRIPRVYTNLFADMMMMNARTTRICRWMCNLHCQQASECGRWTEIVNTTASRGQLAVSIHPPNSIQLHMIQPTFSMQARWRGRLHGAFNQVTASRFAID